MPEDTYVKLPRNRLTAGVEVASATSRVRSFAAKSVKQFAHGLGISVRRMQRLRTDFILTFHLVPPEDGPGFEETIRFLRQNFPIVSLDELLARLQSRPSHQREGVVALTFDDGLRNHGKVAYEVLNRLRVPATFYVCAELVGCPGSIWTWEVHARLERLSKALQAHFFDIAGVSGELQAIVNWMKTIPVDRREEIEKEIRDCTPDFQFTLSERDRFELMDWQQIQNLDPDLITIGSHTATHIDLPQAGKERLDRELSRGKKILESRLNRKVEHFAYPNGNFSPSVLPFVQKYYSSAVTTKRGVVKPGDNPILLNRINAEFDLPRFSWELAATASQGLGS
jgi:peptidoglycan/xylan/chitin deacetylase (PgdA/CDA1 family)